MAKRSSFVKTLNAVARANAKAQRQYEAQKRRSQAEYARQQRAYEKEQRVAERLRLTNEKEQAKLHKQFYLESRYREVNDLNAELTETVKDLETILERTLEVDDKIMFNSLRILDSFPSLKLPSEVVNPKTAPIQQEFTRDVEKPSGLSAFLPWAKSRYEQEMQMALVRYATAMDKYKKDEQQRLATILELKAAYEVNKKAFEDEQRERNQSVDELETAYMEHNPSAIIAYNAMVLERSEHPSSFPQEFQLAYIPGPKELVIEYELPDTAVVPDVQEYAYIKTQDEIRSKARSAKEAKALLTCPI